MKDENHFATAVVRSLRRTAITYRGGKLSAHDHEIMIIALRAQSSLLCDLLPSERGLSRWMTFLGRSAIDIQTLSDTIKYADGVLKQYPGAYSDNYKLFGEDGLPRDVLDFKRQVRDQGLDWGFLSPVEDAWVEYFARLSASSCRILNQWINFMSHITLRDIDLKSDLISEYKALEEDEGTWAYDKSVLHSLNSIMREWLCGLSFAESPPSHGPGSVAGLTRNCGRLRKYEVMSTDLRLDYYLKRNYEDIDTVLPPGGFLENKRLSRTSELICVPKSMTKNRTISKEPCSLQYFQHGAQRRIDEYLRRHPLLRGRIDLHDQEASMQLAQEGSLRGEWATIDLSSASDSVTLSLVKEVFRGTPYLIPAICLRSDKVKLPSGELLAMRKYAPMGSDLCFVTMCLVFACVCEHVIRKTSGRRSRTNEYRVYGDDIVISSNYSEMLVKVLTDLHFKVNEKKSFVRVDIHNFREACGGEYIDGIDVTPLRISRRLHLNTDNEVLAMSSVEAVSSLVELINSTFQKGYSKTRLELLQVLKESCPFSGKLPYTTEIGNISTGYSRSTYLLPKYSTAIITYSWCCTNFRVPHRFHGRMAGRGCQRKQVKVLRPSLSTKSPIRQYRNIYTSEDVRYFEYWLTLPDRPLVVEFGVEILPEPVSGLFPARPTWRESWVSV